MGRVEPFASPESKATLECTILPELDLIAMGTVGAEGLSQEDSTTNLMQAG